MYKAEGNWGIESEMLEGYESKFLRNYSPNPSYLRWPFGLMNMGVWNEIRKEKPDAVIVMAWSNVTWWLAVSACVQFGIPILYMTDANVQPEPSRSLWKRALKRIVLERVLFRLTKGFLCAGTSNRQFYQYYGVADDKLVPFAYSWGYEHLYQMASALRAEKLDLRSQLGIPANKQVILYCGRLSKEKNPRDLLEAFAGLKSSNVALAFVGDGEQKESLMDYTAQHNLHSVYFFGFQDRHEIPKYHAMADLLVLPSVRETWGIVVNEAMCFGLPVIVSEQVGAGTDLVRHEHNGFRFKEGDVQSLTRYIDQFIKLPSEEKELMSKRSSNIIQNWIDRDLAVVLCKYLESILSTREKSST